MPPSVKKRAELSVRREVVRHLIIKVGLSKAEVSKIFGVDEYSITNDCRHIGLNTPDRCWSVERNDAVYRNAFILYAKMMFGKYNEEVNEVSDLLVASLKTYLGIKSIESACVGIADILNCFNRPAVEEEVFGRYRDFLNNVFSVQYVDALEGKALFMSYLQYILENHPARVVPTRQLMTKDIAQWAYLSGMNNPRMPFGSEITNFVEDALKLLHPRQRLVIKARFGLGRPMQNLSEWATESGVTRARAHQIYACGMRRFKNYFPGFAVFTSSIRHSVYVHWFDVANKFKVHSTATVSAEESIALLFESVEILHLPNRARKCFRRAGIETISDLIQQTPKSLMRLNFFGDKCLSETKKALAHIGLSLCMKLG